MISSARYSQEAVSRKNVVALISTVSNSSGNFSEWISKKSVGRVAAAADFAEALVQPPPQAGPLAAGEVEAPVPFGVSARRLRNRPHLKNSLLHLHRPLDAVFGKSNGFGDDLAALQNVMDDPGAVPGVFGLVAELLRRKRVAALEGTGLQPLGHRRAFF